MALIEPKNMKQKLSIRVLLRFARSWVVSNISARFKNWGAFQQVRQYFKCQLRALQWKCGSWQVYWPSKCLFFFSSTRLATQNPWFTRIKATSKTYVGKPSRMSMPSQLGPLDFVTSSTKKEDSAALLSHSQKASGSGLSSVRIFWQDKAKQCL